MYHVKTFFNVWRHDFFALCDVCLKRDYLLTGKLAALFDCHRTVSMAAVHQLTIKYDQDKFGAFFTLIPHHKSVIFPTG